MKYLILIILLSGCSVTSDELKQALEVCKNNEGIQYLMPAPSNLEVRCNNSARFVVK